MPNDCPTKHTFYFISLCLQLQRSLRTCDGEKTEAQERVVELSTSNSSLQSAKRKAEQQLASLQVCTCTEHIHHRAFV